MQQRLGLGVALLGEPDLVILDEPTSALDPVGRADVRAIVRAGARARRDRLPELAPAERGRAGLRPGGDRRPRPGPRERPARRAPRRLGRADPGDRPRRPSAVTALEPVRPRPAGDEDWLVDRRRRPRTPCPRSSPRSSPPGGQVHAVDPGRRSLEDRFVELVGAAPSPADRPRRGRASRCARWRPSSSPGSRSPRSLRRRILWVLLGLTVVQRRDHDLGRRAPRVARPRDTARARSRSSVGVSQILVLVAFMFSFVLAMTAAFLGAPAIAADVESGVAHAMLARPIRRADLVVGRWLGLAVVVVAYAAGVGPARDRGVPPRERLRAAEPARGRRLPGGPGDRPDDRWPCC